MQAQTQQFTRTSRAAPGSDEETQMRAVLADQARLISTQAILIELYQRLFDHQRANGSGQ
jgi:hypothetical protein